MQWLEMQPFRMTCTNVSQRHILELVRQGAKASVAAKVASFDLSFSRLGAETRCGARG